MALAACHNSDPAAYFLLSLNLFRNPQSLSDGASRLTMLDFRMGWS
jgi:hypothetical protein